MFSIMLIYLRSSGKQMSLNVCHTGAFLGLKELQVLDFWFIGDYISSLFKLGCLLSDTVS